MDTDGDGVVIVASRDGQPSEWFYRDPRRRGKAEELWWHVVAENPPELDGHIVELRPSELAADSLEVVLDDTWVGRVRRAVALAFDHGPGAPKAWFITGAPHHDRYLSPWDAARGLAIGYLLNRCHLDTYPLTHKWRWEDEVNGGRRVSPAEFEAAMEEAGWVVMGVPVPRPGLKVPYAREAFTLKP